MLQTDIRHTSWDRIPNTEQSFKWVFPVVWVGVQSLLSGNWPGRLLADLAHCTDWSQSEQAGLAFLFALSNTWKRQAFATRMCWWRSWWFCENSLNYKGVFHFSAWDLRAPPSLEVASSTIGREERVFGQYALDQREEGLEDWGKGPSASMSTFRVAVNVFLGHIAVASSSIRLEFEGWL